MVSRALNAGLGLGGRLVGGLTAKIKVNVTNRVLSEVKKASLHHDLARPGSADNTE